MRYFGNATVLPKFTLGGLDGDDRLIYSGKDIFSAILPPNINYDGGTSYYNEDWSAFIKYEDREKKTIVRNSKIL